ncbi:hypothetical protein ACMT1E_00870 [Sphingomonas flavalba]|uniref:hypothetical protein n=1 Tax=Sphingomonas flavalba TaxID=2559804 RepID=UPI0039E0F834
MRCSNGTGPLPIPSEAGKRRTPGLARAGGHPHYRDMLNILSILIGLFALLLAIPAFMPILGAANWLIVPIALVGIGVGALSRSNTGRNLNIIVFLICCVRLWLGGGIL